MKDPKSTVRFGNPCPLSQRIKGKLSHQAGFTPTILRTFRAILRCKPHSSIDEAITRPLRKRKFVSRKYWGHTFLDGRIPSVGKRQTGSIAVTARGRASVHQKTAISTTTYRHFPSYKETAGRGTVSYYQDLVSWHRFFNTTVIKINQKNPLNLFYHFHFIIKS